MVPVAGVPYLQHQLALLRRQSIRDVVLLIGYLGEQIQDYFGDGRQWEMSIRYSREPQPLGTGGALRFAQHLLADPFLLIYGDSYLPIDYAQIVSELSRSDADGIMVIFDDCCAETRVRKNVSVDAVGHVTRYDKRSAGDGELTHVEAGVLAFRRSVLKLIPEDGVVSLEEVVFPQLIAGRRFAAFPTAQRFYDIGTPDRLRTIEEYLAHDHHANSLSN
jgi:NDP-sugar pyrophosphorylase family protein